MCVKLVSQSEERAYDIDKPLEEQIKDCQQIVVNYQPFDKSVEKLCQEMQRFAKMGIDTKVSIKVVHNDNVVGFRVKKKLERASSDITLNEIIKLMVLSHHETDKKLEELFNTLSQSK